MALLLVRWSLGRELWVRDVAGSMCCVLGRVPFFTQGLAVERSDNSVPLMNCYPTDSKTAKHLKHYPPHSLIQLVDRTIQPSINRGQEYK